MALQRTELGQFAGCGPAVFAAPVLALVAALVAVSQDPPEPEQTPPGPPEPQDSQEPVGVEAPPPEPVDLDDENLADYRIEARLEEEGEGDKRLVGELALTWTNNSGEAVEDMLFHLYWNAFANTLSTHQFEGRGKIRGGEPMQPGQWGWSRVTGVRWVDPASGEETDLAGTFRYVQPDDGREEDLTVFAIDLPRPVVSGESATVEVDWEARVPRVRRRTGHKDDFLLMAHWFPKVGVYEAGRGWYAHQFHLNTEFYSDYGTYDVTLDLPAKYEGLVGGTGTKTLENQVGDGRMVVRFVAPPPPPRGAPERDSTGRIPRVHGFTWSADTNFEVRDFTFKWDEWAEEYAWAVEEVRRAFDGDFSATGTDVAVKVLIQKERVEQAERHYKATAAALFFYGLWYGPYPYPNITVVDPAYGGGAAGGMEYPQIFTAGTSLFTREDMHRPEGVTVHEAGHQFWYGLVGNNEPAAPFLDEGLNSYTDSEVLFRVYGPARGTTSYARYPLDGRHLAPLPADRGLSGWLTFSRLSFGSWLGGFTARPLPRHGGFLDAWLEQPLLTLAPSYGDPRWRDRSGYLRDPASDLVTGASWKFVDSTSYRTNSYPRPAVALRSIAGIVGRPAFLRGMRHFAEEWRYRHPYPEDFFASFLEGAGLGEEDRWIFDELFEGTGTVDWSVEVIQARAIESRGWFPGDDGAFQPPPEEAESEEPAPEADAAEPAEEPETPERPWHTDIVVRRRGELRLPLPVYVEFESGESELWVWAREVQTAGPWGREEAPDTPFAYVERGASGNWIKLRYEGPDKVLRVVLDPPDAAFGPTLEHPDRRYFLDTDMSNNEWYDRRDRLTPWRWGERVFTQYAHFLHRIGGLGG